MKILSGPHRRRSEAGVALLIAIFVLLLVSVTAIALILSSGAESALAGNYRSSAITYYAALAGLEEARGRLLPSNPDYLGPVLATLGTPLPLGKVLYIKNPLPGEVVNPTDLSNPATYPDTQYATEFAGTPYATPTQVQPVNSVSPAAGLPGPLYKWVRINAATEASLNVNVDNRPLPLDSTTPLFYDNACLDTPGHPGPTLCVNHSANAVQALEITALASLPNGTQKLLQYIVAPASLYLNFGGPPSSNPSIATALTLVGNNVNFTGPTLPGALSSFNINGNDQFNVGACTPGPTAASAIGYSNASDSSLENILNGIAPGSANHYFGAGASPNVVNVTGLPQNLQTPSGLDALVQNISQNADAVIPGPADQSDLPHGMSASNPMTVVVNGDFRFNGNNGGGYGLLLVTGTFTYDPNEYTASWRGLVLVIGQGKFVSTTPGNGEIDGAVLVANTRDAAGNLLPALGPASFTQTGGGLGIYYSSCWLNAAGLQRPATYKVLSYRQLSQ
jgi:hypothetical protein